MNRPFHFVDQLLEKGLLPDSVIRCGIRRLLFSKLVAERLDGLQFGQARFMKLIQTMRNSPIAVNTSAANEQHYEVPTEFFSWVLGKHLKYSCGYWRPAASKSDGRGSPLRNTWNKRPGVTDLDQAEEDMLEITTERADLSDGQSILELGCGWGSLSLFMAKKFPKSRIVGVSNSKTQKAYIDGQASERGLKNLQIITADMNTLEMPERFDRVVSVEMFEHMCNYEKLLEKVAGFLKDYGRLFVHVFTHREYAYFYDGNNDLDWIGKYFFTGGIMPSDHLLLYFQRHFKIENHWRVSGTHYQKTSEAWLSNMDRHKKEIWPILERTYGSKEARKWWNYWRVFFMSCAELWGYKNGTEWIVSHYLFQKR